MSYNKEVAQQPLTGEAYDVLILQEREQRHMIGEGELTDFHIMPAAEYCELRDAYKKLIEEREAMPAYPIEPGNMTLEQAIAILEPETTRAALYEYQYYGGFRGKEAQIKACEEACRIAAAVMRGEVSRRRREGDDPHCRECRCPSCGLFQTEKCLEGADHCDTKCDHKSHTSYCPYHPNEQ